MIHRVLEMKFEQNYSRDTESEIDKTVSSVIDNPSKKVSLCCFLFRDR